jgi:hypothetical protein
MFELRYLVIPSKISYFDFLLKQRIYFYIFITVFLVIFVFFFSKNRIVSVRYHCGGSMELNARILLLAYMVYL